MNYLKQFQFCFPYSNELLIPVNWSVKVNEYSKDIEKENPWMLKGGEFARIWQIWHYTYPNAKWLIVRRRTGDIIQSCVKTGYMKTFKSQNNLVSLGLEVEEEGWLWWVHRYEEKFVEMIHAGVNCRIVWVDRMSTGNYQQMYETVNWLGLNWNDKIPSKIGPLLKVKEVKDGSKNVSSISEANN